MTVPNSFFPALAHAIDPTILHSIRQASLATSTNFGLLMAQAAQESGFNADAQSSTSSAAGLFQFIDSTWLDMVRRFGAKYGVGQLAKQIGVSGNGQPFVSDPATRREILDLRRNPTLSAELAGEYMKHNQTKLEAAHGHPLKPADIYMAHFLGADGATAFLKAVETKGNTIAANLLPDAAAANKAIFYDASGKPRTVAEIYDSLANKIDSEATALSSLAPSEQWAANTDTGSASAASPGISAMARPVDWSGVKLSPQVLDMLNIVALAALKMADTVGTRTPVPTASPHERHSA